MYTEELGTLDEPVVLFDLVVQHVGGREVGVQCVDQLLGLLLGNPERLALVDLTVRLAGLLLRAHDIRTDERHPLRCFYYVNSAFDN